MNKIICVIDNETQSGQGLSAEHGLSFYIETSYGNVLFDTGQTSTALSHNFSKLGIEINKISALVLSHSHFDHTGGLSFVINSNKDIPIYAHSNLFEKRYYRVEEETRSVGLSDENEALLRNSNLKLSSQPVEIVPRLWTTGDIKVRKEPLGSSPFLYTIKDNEWMADPYSDDMSLVFETTEGLILICGCCHAGILNTMFHVEDTFNQSIIAVLGGIHLVYSTEQYLNHVFEIMNQNYSNTKFLLNHCTGENALRQFKDNFGDRVIGFPTGSEFSF